MNSRLKKPLSFFLVLLFVVIAWLGVGNLGTEVVEQKTLWEDLLETSSIRSMPASTVIVERPELALVAAPLSIYYEGDGEEDGCDEAHVEPLLVGNGEASSNFLSVYSANNTLFLGSGGSGDIVISGSNCEISYMAAEMFWNHTTGVLIITEDSLDIGIALAPLASYANIPIILAGSSDDAHISPLAGLGVEYSLVCGNATGVGRVYRMEDPISATRLVIDYMVQRFGSVDYISVANTNDVDASHGLADMSLLAPFLSAGRRGVVVSSPIPLLPEINFEEEDGTNANPHTEMVKQNISACLNYMMQKGVYDAYAQETPFLALHGGPYSIPFYYAPGPEGWESVATDDYYADLDGDYEIVDLACGRPIALTVEGASALCSRALCYDRYMCNWEADSRVTEALGDEWDSTAYVAKGDDWNGAIWAMTPEYWDCMKYFHDNQYNVVTTKRHQTGGSVAQDRMRLYTSSSFIYVMAHGYPEGYQNFDMIHSSDVKEWGIVGPSSMILTSCSAARIDVENVDETISLTFMAVSYTHLRAHET